MDIIRFDEMKKTWHQISRHHDGNIPPDFELEVYKKMLGFFHVGSFYYYIFNVAATKMEFVSESITPVLGIAPGDFSAEFIFENLHPEDKARFAASEQKVTEFFNKLPPEKVLKYKVSYDYRLRCTNGSYKWILMQTVTLQSDESGAVIRVLGVQTDITHLKSDNTSSGLTFLGLDGEPSFYNVPLHQHSIGITTYAELFSPREKEVLRLVLSGINSADIAAAMSLSLHTVNTHRKNILAKSGCNSLTELVARAAREGWV